MTQSCWKAVASIAAISMAAPAHGSETTTYTYDTLGRLVKVERAGTVNDGVKSEYSYDKADNRTNVTVTAPNPCTNATAKWGAATYGCFRWGS